MLAGLFAVATDQVEAFEEARVEFDEKNAAYERTLAAKGFRPPWPPKTPEGMAVWDVTPEDIAKWESSRR